MSLSRPAIAKRSPWTSVENWVLLTEMPHISCWLQEQIGSAQLEILFEIYMFAAGDWPGQLLDLLCQKATAGIHVHLRLDAVGSRLFPKQWVHRLQAAGAQFSWYHRLAWHSWERSLRRSHRRLLVIDGQWLVVGGFAIADAWLGSSNEAPYRDVLLACQGSIATLGRALYLGQKIIPPAAPNDPSTTLAARILSASPPQRITLRHRYLAAFRAARESIWISTPYFNPDPQVLSTLYHAVRRGVDVRILLAGRVTDHPLLRLGIQAYYQKLLRHGVRVYEYQGTFLHAKYVLVDGNWGSVGSANLDFLSLWFNRELNLELRGVACTLLRVLFLREFAVAMEISVEQWQRRPWYRRPLEWFFAQIDRRIQLHALGSRRY